MSELACNERVSLQFPPGSFHKDRRTLYPQRDFTELVAQQLGTTGSHKEGEAELGINHSLQRRKGQIWPGDYPSKALIFSRKLRGIGERGPKPATQSLQVPREARLTSRRPRRAVPSGPLPVPGCYSPADRLCTCSWSDRALPPGRSRIPSAVGRPRGKSTRNGKTAATPTFPIPAAPFCILGANFGTGGQGESQRKEGES